MEGVMLNAASDFSGQASPSAMGGLQGFGLLFCFAIVKMISEKSNAFEKPSGIGGWLTFFIVTSLCATLFSLLFSIVLFVSEIRKNFQSLDFTFIWAFIDIIYQVVFTYSLYSLCKIRHGAVVLIKKLLVFNFFYVAILPIAHFIHSYILGDYPYLTFDSIVQQYDILNIALAYGHWCI